MNTRLKFFWSGLLGFALASLVGRAFGADGEATAGGASNPFGPLLDLLGGHAGRVVQIVTLIGSLRVVFKLFSGRIQEFFERALARVVETSDTEDDHIAEIILRSWLYRLFAFLVDMLTSLKLPLVLPVNARGEVSASGQRVTSLILLPFLLAAALVAGCSSTQQRRVFNASSISHTTVRSALQGWNDYLGQAYTEAGTNVAARAELLKEESAVKDLFDKYRLAQLAVIDASAAVAQTANTTNAPPLDNLQTAVNASAEAGADLLALLAQFGIVH